MNKRVLYLSLIPLLLASCSKNATSSTSSFSSSSSEEPQVEYTSKTIKAKYLHSEYNTTTDIRFYEGSHIPYISLKEFHQLLYRGRTYQEGRDKFLITKDNNQYTIEVDGGYTATFDIKENTLTSSNLWGFKNTNLFGVGDLMNVSYDGLPFTRVKSVSSNKEPDTTIIDFHKYDMKIYGDETSIYVPITFATDLFSNENILAGAYNNQDLYFFNYTENENISSFKGDYYEPIFANAIPEDYAIYAYNELCLDYDYFLGRPGRSALERYYDLSNGLDEALQSRPLGQTIRSYLRSNSLAEFLAGSTILGYLRQDGGHSAYNPLNTTYIDSTNHLVKPEWLTDEIESRANTLINIEYSKGYEELLNIDEVFSHHYEVYRARHEQLGKPYSAIKGTETYTKDGDIAYIHIDGFMGEINLQDEWRDYYEGKTENIPFGNGKGGAVGAIHYGLTEASNDPEIKHIVIDLAANTGGSTDEMLFMICLLTGQNKFYCHNTLSNIYQTVEYEFDLNFDRIFDEHDAEVDLVQGKDVTVLTTRNGFSCGGISPIYLHEEGLFTIGENCGGGSCSIYIQFDAYGNMNRSSCPNNIVTKNGVSIDIARNTSCDHTIDFPYNQLTGYDYSELYNTATLRTLIEAHYQ